MYYHIKKKIPMHLIKLLYCKRHLAVDVLLVYLERKAASALCQGSLSTF